jgi:hypothetical protein
MWVICAGMLRAGSTWQYLIASEIIEQYLGGARAAFARPELIAVARTEDKQTWRSVKIHDKDLFWSHLLTHERALGLYVFRDIRDVTFSLMHKRGISFESLMARGTLFKIMDNDAFWRRQPGVLTQQYERMCSDAAASIGEISSHLGVLLPPSVVTQLATSYSLTGNIERCNVFKAQLATRGLDLSDRRFLEVRDSETQLHWNHIRNGAIGGWREEGTAEQKRRLNLLCRKWLADNNYDLD